MWFSLFCVILYALSPCWKQGGRTELRTSVTQGSGAIVGYWWECRELFCSHHHHALQCLRGVSAHVCVMNTCLQTCTGSLAYLEVSWSHSPHLPQFLAFFLITGGGDRNTGS